MNVWEKPYVRHSVSLWQPECLSECSPISTSVRYLIDSRYGYQRPLRFRTAYLGLLNSRWSIVRSVQLVSSAASAGGCVPLARFLTRICRANPIPGLFMQYLDTVLSASASRITLYDGILLRWRILLSVHNSTGEKSACGVLDRFTAPPMLELSENWIVSTDFVRVMSSSVGNNHYTAIQSDIF